MKSAALRQRFLDFFQSYQHQIVPSSSLIPANDPSLLFTNAGMVQFKDVFLGKEQRDYVRAASSQRCVRAGGKHNDLENVGYTARHHTFFEMLGNFSFGDYFKQQAIEYAWEFLTKALNLPEEKLWVTVYEKDQESEDIWLNHMKIDPTRFARIDEKDNFWSMGDVGPCGPCSEIFYDHGEQVAGGPPGSADADGDRFVEIWNLVFMQYNRDAQGQLHPLPHPSVDTGMGLERLAAVMQGVHSNYDIDLFQNLIQASAKVIGCQDLSHSALQVIADHIRSTVFLIIDGVYPCNEGRGYVLRRIMRRAIRHAYQLGQQQPFFYQLVQPLVAEMGQAYPELLTQQAKVEQVIQREEERFAETIEQGLKILQQHIDTMSGNVIAGEIIFLLYDTYGFPVDLSNDIAREKQLQLDMAGFEQAMQQQKQRGKATGQFKQVDVAVVDTSKPTAFIGYQHLTGQAKITQLYANNKAVTELMEGQQGMIVLEHTPFYAESGGQVGDTGQIILDKNCFEVTDTQKTGKVFTHIGVMKTGSLSVGQTVDLIVAGNKRKAIALNHSATHLMHAALKRVLGDHVMQKGSLVDEQRLRFDFSHFQPVTKTECQQIETLVNQQIRHNSIVETKIMDLDEAKKTGAMALFDEKYDDKVRVLKMGDFSIELCGGTHVNQLGEIGLFKIIHETGIASGVRRIEAVTGEEALLWVEQQQQQLEQMAGLLKTETKSVIDKLQQLIEDKKQTDKNLQQLKAKLAGNQSQALLKQVEEIQGIKILARRLDGVDAKSLPKFLDQIKAKLDSAVIVLATVTDNKVHLIAGVTPDCTDKIQAGKLVNMVANQVGGKGGGRADMARAGGTDPSQLKQALASVKPWVEQLL